MMLRRPDLSRFMRGCGYARLATTLFLTACFCKSHRGKTSLHTFNKLKTCQLFLTACFCKSHRGKTSLHTFNKLKTCQLQSVYIIKAIVRKSYKHERALMDLKFNMNLKADVMYVQIVTSCVSERQYFFG